MSNYENKYYFGVGLNNDNTTYPLNVSDGENPLLKNKLSLREIANRIVFLNNSQKEAFSLIEQIGGIEDVVKFIHNYHMENIFDCLPIAYKANIDIVLACIKYNHEVFKFLPEGFLNTKKDYCNILDINPNVYLMFSEDYQCDNDIVEKLIFLKEDAWNILNKKAKLKLLSSRKEIKKILQNRDSFFQYVAPSFSQDKDIAFLALVTDHTAINYIDQALKNDRKFILKAMKAGSYASLSALPQYIADREICKIVLARNGRNYIYLDNRLKKSKKLIKIALESLLDNGKYHIQEIMTHIPDRLMKDNDFLSQLLDIIVRFLGDKISYKQPLNNVVMEKFLKNEVLQKNIQRIKQNTNIMVSYKELLSILEEGIMMSQVSLIPNSLNKSFVKF